MSTALFGGFPERDEHGSLVDRDGMALADACFGVLYRRNDIHAGHGIGWVLGPWRR